MDRTEKTRAFFNRLTLPTHPEFDLLTDSGSMDYTPPATLANYIVLYTNAAIELTESVVLKQRDMERENQSRKTAQRALSSFERGLLARNQAPAAATKNLKVTEAYVTKCATDAGRASEYEE